MPAILISLPANRHEPQADFRRQLEDEQDGPSETKDFVESILSKIQNQPSRATWSSLPAFVSLPKAAEALNNHPASPSRRRTCAQNDSGAFTGEISVVMLRELFVRYVILGHSERRAIYGETDAVVNAKLKTAREADSAADRLHRRNSRGTRGGQAGKSSRNADAPRGLAGCRTATSRKPWSPRTGLGDWHRRHRHLRAGAGGPRLHPLGHRRDLPTRKSPAKCASSTAAA